MAPHTALQTLSGCRAVGGRVRYVSWAFTRRPSSFLSRCHLNCSSNFFERAFSVRLRVRPAHLRAHAAHLRRPGLRPSPLPPPRPLPASPPPPPDHIAEQCSRPRRVQSGLAQSTDSLSTGATTERTLFVAGAATGAAPPPRMIQGYSGVR
jgi:hypothetical protein